MGWGTPRGRTAPAYVEAATTEEGLALLAGAKKRRKWGNTPTDYNGVTYDSKGEAGFAQRLDMLKAAGHIHDWRRGKDWLLLEAPNEIKYRPDFEVWLTPDDFRLIDFKGALTDVFELKAKLFKSRYPTVPLWLAFADGTERLA